MRTKITSILNGIRNELKDKRLEEIDGILRCNVTDKEYIKQTIVITSDISLLESTYKEQIEQAEEFALSTVENNKDIRWFEFQKQYLTVDVCRYDPCVESTTLHLKSEVLVDKLETDEEYTKRILNKFAPELLNETEYILNQIYFELDKRTLTVACDNIQYIFDVKVQDIRGFEQLLENGSKERFLQELVKKDKQIFLK